MAKDHALDLRRALVAHFRADAALIALVDPSRIFPEFAGDEPAYPFIRIGYMNSTGFEATGWDGSEHALTIHAFARGPDTVAIYRISAEVVASMERFEPAAFGLPENYWESTQVLPDPTPDILHAVILYTVQAVEVV